MRFVTPFNRICGYDIQEYLSSNGYITRYYSKKQKKIIERHYVNDKNYKKEAKLYSINRKLKNLNLAILNDAHFTNIIDKNLHHLSGQYFNHYYHSYRNIKIDIPYERINEIPFEQKLILERWGDPLIKDFDIYDFGFDNNEWAGEHINTFNFINKTFLNYTSLGDVVEVGLRHYREILLADQLLKTLGENDYSEFFKKTRFTKKKVKVNEIIKGKKKRVDKQFKLISLFRTKDDYNLSSELPLIEFWTAVCGYQYIETFAKRFPKAFNFLYNVKRGINTREGAYFNGFTFNIKPIIFKDDIRLIVKKDHQSFMRGQIFYKIVPLVLSYRILQLMHEFWMKLKKCGIMFIPLEGSVVVSKQYEVAATYIFKSVLKNQFDKSLMCEILHLNLNEVPSEIQILNALEPYKPENDIPVPPM